MKETQEGCLSRAINTNFVACKDNKICKPGEYMWLGLAKELPAKRCFASGETHPCLPSFLFVGNVLDRTLEWPFNKDRKRTREEELPWDL